MYVYKAFNVTSAHVLRVLHLYSQVVVVAIKNRGLSLPENPNELHEINEKESVSAEAKIVHTAQFR